MSDLDKAAVIALMMISITATVSAANLAAGGSGDSSSNPFRIEWVSPSSTVKQHTQVELKAKFYYDGDVNAGELKKPVGNMKLQYQDDGWHTVKQSGCSVSLSGDWCTLSGSFKMPAKKTDVRAVINGEMGMATTQSKIDRRTLTPECLDFGTGFKAGLMQLKYQAGMAVGSDPCAKQISSDNNDKKNSDQKDQNTGNKDSGSDNSDSSKVSGGNCLASMNTEFAKQYKALKNGKRNAIDVNPFTDLEKRKYNGIVRPEKVPVKDGCTFLVVVEGETPNVDSYNLMLNGPVKDSNVQSRPRTNWVLPIDNVTDTTINGNKYQIGEVTMKKKADMVFPNGDRVKKDMLVGHYSVQLSRRNGNSKFSLNGPSMDTYCPDSSCYRHEDHVTFQKPDFPIAGDKFRVEILLDNDIINYYDTPLDIGTLYIGGKQVKNFIIDPSTHPDVSQNDIKGFNNFTLSSSDYSEGDRIVVKLSEPRPSRTLYIRGPVLDFKGVGQDGYANDGSTGLGSNDYSGKERTSTSKDQVYKNSGVRASNDQILEGKRETLTVTLKPSDSKGGATLVLKNTTDTKRWDIKKGVTKYTKSFIAQGDGKQIAYLVNRTVEKKNGNKDSNKGDSQSKDASGDNQDQGIIANVQRGVWRAYQATKGAVATGWFNARTSLSAGGGGGGEIDVTDLTKPSGTILDNATFEIVPRSSWKQYCTKHMEGYSPDPTRGVQQVKCVKKIVAECFVSSPEGDCARDANGDGIYDVQQSVCQLKHKDYVDYRQACK